MASDRVELIKLGAMVGACALAGYLLMRAARGTREALQGVGRAFNPLAPDNIAASAVDEALRFMANPSDPSRALDEFGRPLTLGAAVEQGGRYVRRRTTAVAEKGGSAIFAAEARVREAFGLPPGAILTGEWKF